MLLAIARYSPSQYHLFLSCLALCAACAGSVHHLFAPDRPHLAGEYTWETGDGVEGTLMLHTPADTAGRDTLMTSQGWLLSCKTADPAGPLQCGSFTFHVVNERVVGEFESCLTTLVPERVIHIDPSTGQETRGSVYSASQACEPKPLRVRKVGVHRRHGDAPPRDAAAAHPAPAR